MQVLLMVDEMAVLFLVLRPLENNALPSWDGAAARTSLGRDVALGCPCVSPGWRPWP